MLHLLWVSGAWSRYFMRRYMPTNVPLDQIRARLGLKRGDPTTLMAAPYLIAASICVNLIALLFRWNALKFVAVGPISLILLAGACHRTSVFRGHRYHMTRNAGFSSRLEKPAGRNPGAEEGTEPLPSCGYPSGIVPS